MRLWHESLIPLLPTQQLLGQHRELCALRGLSWNKKHSIVDYVFIHPYNMLFEFHVLVMEEMERRHYCVNPLWKDIHYRGQRIGYDYSAFTTHQKEVQHPIYVEHDDTYLDECLKNLEQKGTVISIESSQ